MQEHCMFPQDYETTDYEEEEKEETPPSVKAYLSPSLANPPFSRNICLTSQFDPSSLDMLSESPSMYKRYQYLCKCPSRWDEESLVSNLNLVKI